MFGGKTGIFPAAFVDKLPEGLAMAVEETNPEKTLDGSKREAGGSHEKVCTID